VDTGLVGGERAERLAERERRRGNRGERQGGRTRRVEAAVLQRVADEERRLQALKVGDT
jgi:hypothetical protein